MSDIYVLSIWSMRFPKKVGLLHGVRIYESSWLGYGRRSAGLALPGIGIFVGEGVYSRRLDVETVYHEYGHILQAKLTGRVSVSLVIGVQSLGSGWTQWHGRRHQEYWTETWCNHLASSFFKDCTWPYARFPAKDTSAQTRYWLVRLS